MKQRAMIEDMKVRIEQMESEIAALKEEQVTLQDLAQKYLYIEKDTQDAYYEVDLAGNYIFFNDALCHIMGRSRDEILGMNNREYTSAETAKKMFEIFNTIYKTGEPAQIRDYEIIKKDGDKRIVELSVSLMRDSNGSIIGFRGIGRDTTERRRAEERIKESEQRFADIINFLPDATLAIDCEGTVIAWNRAIEEMTGVEAPQMIGKADHEYALPFYGVRRPILIDLVLNRDNGFEDGYHLIRREQDGLIIETDAIKVKGKNLFLWAKASPIYDRNGNVVGAIETIRDISEQKHAEEALRESEANYRDLVQNANSIILRRNIAGTITFFNEFAQKFFSYEEDEIIGKNVVGTIIPKNDSSESEHADMIKDMALYPDKYVTSENENVRSDGERVWVAWTNKAIYDRDGNIREFLCIGNDMTERKKAEEEKMQLEDQLSHAQKMEAIGTLAGGLAHDFNNLLMGMQGRTSLMLMDIDASHPFYDHLKQQEDIVISGANLTRQLLGFARGGKYEVKPSNINTIIEKTADMFGRTKKEITIHGKYEDDIWSVEVDQGQIEQVFVNLFINAWQAMPGGGNLFIETGNIVLKQKVARKFNITSGNYVKMSVTDTGVGMDEATKRRIFEPFFTTKTMGRGTGLGLASVYGIIKNHEGVIDVQSKKGQGTTFSIYLPALERKDETAALSPETKVVPGFETILLVDDEPFIRDVGNAILGKLGYNVIVAESGREALKAIEHERENIHMIILDMIMPEMSGGEVFDRIKEIQPRAKVLLSSGYSVNTQAQEILDKGCDGFIQKPFKIEDLSKKIREILDPQSS
jgi:two-component system cell cycle sensor histidine kinase/response regulator CckA